MDDVIIELSKKFSGIVIFTAGGIMALDKLGLNVMPFVAGAGVAGVAIGISYESNLKRAKEIIVQICLELDWVMKMPEPKVVVRSFGESSVDLQARVWISNPRRRMDTISYITDHVKEVFDKEGIEIPYPKREIYIKRRSPKKE